MFSRENTNTIRYACCFIVVFSHIMFPETYLYLGYPHFVCVTIFFLLSGYGLMASFLDDREKCLHKQSNRIVKLIYPLVFVILIENSIDIPLGTAGLWWFDVLILYYIAFGLLLLLVKNKYLLVFLNSVFVLAYSVFFQEIIMIRGVDLGWTNYFGWAQQSLGFIGGMIIALWKNRIFEIYYKYKAAIAILSVAMLIPSGLVYIRPHDITRVTNEQFIIRTVISFACINLLIILLFYVSFGNKLTKYVGEKLSIYIFAIHGLFIGIINKYFNGIDNNIKIILIVVLSILGAVCMYNLKLLFLNVYVKIKKERKYRD